jgi:ureidoglycolate hydrolase
MSINTSAADRPLGPYTDAAVRLRQEKVDMTGAAARVIELHEQPLTPESFAPFGVLPPEEGDGAPTADLEFLLDDGWVNYISHSVDEIDVIDGALRCDVLNRHDTHTQTLMPVDADAVMVVAPPGVDFSQAGHLDTVRAFAVPRHSCVHLHRGTWHWGPYPSSEPRVRIFNIQGRGYPTDNTVAHLSRLGVIFALRAQA